MELSPYDSACIYRVKERIDQDLRQHYSISQLAATAGIGATKLKKGFKILFGKGIYEYLRYSRLEGAAELLADRGKTIKQIARISGYRHTTNFNTAFTRHFGITPRRYRQRL